MARTRVKPTVKPKPTPGGGRKPKPTPGGGRKPKPSPGGSGGAN